MLIVRIDAIGDYILYRNFIKLIKESERYKNYSITLLGNKIWKDIAEEYDNEYIDKFIWIDTNNFFKKSEWRKSILLMLKLRNSGFETILIPNDTRNWRTDFIISNTGVKNIIMKRDDSFLSRNGAGKKAELLHNGSDHNPQSSYFQFYRNKYFTEELIGCNIQIQKPFFENNNRENTSGDKVNEEYIVIFPGASDIKKMWAAENFGILCRKISEIMQVKFVICGNESDKSAAKKIMKISGIQNIEDKTKDGSLIELIDLISDAKLLITNDTCALHIGAALNTKTICISNGLHFARFHPYPKELSDQVITLYPIKDLIKYKNYGISARKFHLSSDLDINKISCEEVFNSVKNVIELSEQEEYLIKTSETVNL